MNFFDKENISEVRLRSFFKLIQEDTVISSEGSYQFEILNVGDDTATLEDVSGNTWTMLPGFQFEFNRLIFVGHPGIIRDDIIKVTFEGVGVDPKIQVKFDRFVKKGDTQTYPGQ